MATVDLFAIGNALIDQEFRVTDEFLTQQNLQKGTMQLAEGDVQSALYENLKATQVYKGQASGGSAANTTVAFSALGGKAFYACRVGNDELGLVYLNGLNAADVKTSAKSISDGVTVLAWYSSVKILNVPCKPILGLLLNSRKPRLISRLFKLQSGYILRVICQPAPLHVPLYVKHVVLPVHMG